MKPKIEIIEDMNKHEKIRITFDDSKEVLINITDEGDIMLNSFNTDLEIKYTHPSSISLKLKK